MTGRRCIAISVAALLAGGATTPPAAPAPRNATVCEPDAVSQRSVDPDLAGISWLASLDSTSGPLKVRLEARGAKRIPLIEQPIDSSYQGPNGTWIVEGALLDPTPRPGLGGAVTQQVVHNFTLTVRDLQVERGMVGYRLGPTELLTKFVFECHRPRSALKASVPNMTANSAGGEG